MRVVLSCIRLGAIHRFAYRLEVATALAGALVMVVLNASIWGAVMDGRDQLAGLGGDELRTYVVLAWVVSAVTASRVDENLGNRFRTGQVASDLTRPLDLQLFLVARDVGRAAASLALTALPALAISAALYPVLWPHRWTTWPAVGLSLLLGVLLGAQLGFLVGVSSFRLQSVVGLAHLRTTAVVLLSGAAVPLVVVPDLLRPWVMALPFQGMVHTPVVIFLERVPAGEVSRLLAVQAAWVGALLVACRLAWRRALGHLAVQGG